MGLYLDLDEHEADQLVAALQADGIPVSKEPAGGGDWQVRVDRRDVGASLELLRAQGLPAVRYGGDPIGQRPLHWSAGEEQRLQATYAASQQLSRELRQVPGVLDARVHLVVLAEDPLTDRLRPSSAAVLVTHAPGAVLQRLAPAVRSLVARRIAGLPGEKVALTLVQAAPEPSTGGGDRMAAALSGRTLGLLLLLLAVAACLMWWTAPLRGPQVGE
ncbi:EscJ/YscJ/HrcJ family type III secretion inner membrane ring protein [Eleftheria terrae]|uniref:EscJ/YscJ/HrcJ family type III secretion inner membrane ring protein n=1 Tax=Eleftheria terrae TaxID=1597781 RepID=UPI00263B555A|nr:EscJ/YscJ/HrcJ family type III secretion inner membrane ring protein [Eleftheria terrae]WKB52913.1 EscJ/YscJ/HrcJ family type III secretion inner membrane ring protein [Eleftheria terrae]